MVGGFYRPSQCSNNYELIIFYIQEKIYMTSGVPALRRSVRRDRLGLLECSSRLSNFLDSEMNDAQDDPWRGSLMA
jgi:hypothetical protein